MHLEKLTLPHTQDFGAYDLDSKRERAMIEIKCRNISSTQYPTVIISSHKVASGASYCEVTGTPYLIYFEFTDRLMFYKHETTDWIAEVGGELWVAWGGRSKKTRDPKDNEPVVHIPITLLETVRGYVHPTPAEIVEIQRRQTT